MQIIEVASGNLYPIDVIPLETNDYMRLTSTRYFFNWIDEKKYECFKLVMKGNEDVKGLISFERIPEEWRIHIRLITVSKENKGKKKIFDRITGNLLCHVAKIAVAEYGELACISLRPKTIIAKHYVDKYKMSVTGMTLSLEVPELTILINQFDHD